MLRTTVHSSIKEPLFARNYGRKPRMEIINYLNISPTANTNVVSAKPGTLQVYSFASYDGRHDQLIMKPPRRFKEGVSNSFLYLFLEQRENNDKFESAYNTKPQITVAGTKPTITTHTKTIKQRERAIKPITSFFQNALSR